MDGFLQPKCCYKVDPRGPVTLEKNDVSELFFGNETLLHVVFPLDEGLSTMMKDWVDSMGSLSPTPWFQYRVVYWVQQIWLILSMNQVEMYSFVVHVHDCGHELAIERLEHKNANGYLETFPFYGPNFRTLQQTASQQKNE